LAYLGGSDSSSGRKLVNSGTGFYLKGGGKFFKGKDTDLSNVDISLTTYFTIGTDKGADFKVPLGTKFFTTRNYVDLFIKQDDIARLSDWGAVFAGIGVSATDVKYLQITSMTEAPTIADSKFDNGFRYSVNSELGLANIGGLLSHSVGVILNYNISEETGYLGLKANLMVSNVFGFDFKIMTPIRMSSASQPAYRPDTYLVFSPIIRINY